MASKTSKPSSLLASLLRNGAVDVLLLLLICTPLAFLPGISRLDPSYWLNNFSSNYNRLTTKTLYEVYNSHHEPSDETSNFLTLVDVKDFTSRQRIAHLIDNVYSLDPMCIAVDFIFPTPQDELSDKTLVETVGRVKDKTVFAYMLKDFDASSGSFGSSSHSFFLNPDYEQWYCSDDVMEGYANLKNDGTGDPIWQYSVVERENGQEVYSLPAMLIGKENFSDYRPHESHIINFKKQKLNILTPDSLDSDLIRNHMVIIGSYLYSGDRFDTPVGLIPGMAIHSYVIQTENGDSITEQSSLGNLGMTAVSLLLLIIVLIAVDMMSMFLAERCGWKFGAMLVDGLLPSIFIGIIAVLAVKSYSYHLLMDCNVFAHGQSAFNGILIAAAIIKVIYTAAIGSCCRHQVLNGLTKYSIYRKSK